MSQEESGELCEQFESLNIDLSTTKYCLEQFSASLPDIDFVLHYMPPCLSCDFAALKYDILKKRIVTLEVMEVTKKLLKRVDDDVADVRQAIETNNLIQFRHYLEKLDLVIFISPTEEIKIRCLCLIEAILRGQFVSSSTLDYYKSFLQQVDVACRQYPSDKSVTHFTSCLPMLDARIQSCNDESYRKQLIFFKYLIENELVISQDTYDLLKKTMEFETQDSLAARLDLVKL